MAQFPITYGSKAVNDQLVAVPQQYAFLPGNALGPTLRGVGSSPLQTLPSGINVVPRFGGAGSPSPLGSVSTGAPNFGGATSNSSGGPMKIALVLTAMLVAGVLILDRVHWRG